MSTTGKAITAILLLKKEIIKNRELFLEIKSIVDAAEDSLLKKKLAAILKNVKEVA